MCRGSFEGEGDHKIHPASCRGGCREIRGRAGAGGRGMGTLVLLYLHNLEALPCINLCNISGKHYDTHRCSLENDAPEEQLRHTAGVDAVSKHVVALFDGLKPLVPQNDEYIHLHCLGVQIRFLRQL